MTTAVYQIKLIECFVLYDLRKNQFNLTIQNIVTDVFRTNSDIWSLKALFVSRRDRWSVVNIQDNNDTILECKAININASSLNWLYCKFSNRSLSSKCAFYRQASSNLPTSLSTMKQSSVRSLILRNELMKIESISLEKHFQQCQGKKKKLVFSSILHLWSFVTFIAINRYFII